MDTGIGIGMVAVPPGDVTISDRRTQSSWNVQLEPYLLDSRPITRASYSAVAGSGARGSSRTDQRPADSVSWFDAIQFCNTLSERQGLTPAYDADAHAE
ncbi:MAG: hypothetical protein ABIY38_06050, partial [Rhodococcus sp. (in: high G+C Gram-positive bacteria)]